MDLLLQKNDIGVYDFVIENKSFKQTQGYESSIQVSILTDKRADSTEVSDPIRRQGFVGDLLIEDLSRKLGSKLWVLAQSRITQLSLNNFNEEIRLCLKWMIEDGIVTKIDIDTSTSGSNAIKINIEFIYDDNTIERYAILWKNTELSLIEG